MTAINVASLLIYTKGAPFREKIQAFALALIFLVLLYDSPSGLVFYWILNQIFSLCKNIVLKTKHPRRILYAFLCAVLLSVSAYLILFKNNKFSSAKCAFYFLTAIFIFAPFILKFLRGRKNFKNCEIAFAKIFSSVPARQETALMVLSCAVLWLLCGLLLPSNVIATSPAEFAFLGNTDSPISYICSSLAFFAGLFVFWPLVIYKMFGANKKVRSAMPVIFFVLAICALANAFLFKHDYGVLSLSFMFDGGKVFAHNYFFFGFLPFVFMCVPIVFYVCMKKTNYQNVFLFAIVCAQILISVGNIEKIRKNYREVFTKYEVDSQIPDGIVDENGNIVPQFHLSRTRKNVVVLFLDRAISCFFPYVLQEFSELKTDFDGFVYYPNCVSFGGHTITGSSAMFGGYEYTGASMNERKSVLLKDKHNEALSLMPRIFSEAGFEVTVVDLPYTNYKMYFDKTVLSDIKNVNALELSKKVGDKYLAEHSSDFTINEDVVCSQRIKKFCFMEVIFPLLRKKFYDGGRYCSEIQLLMEKYSKSFFDSYSELFYLDELTEFDASNDTFTIIANDLTHYNNDFTLIGSDYRPGMSIKGNNESKTGFYDATTKGEITSYQVNACAYLLLSKWLKYLRKNNCYDNTRIIVVADHGFFENYVPFRHFKKSDDDFCAGAFNPLLLFKDFDMHGEPEVDNAFTSNAETPNLAIRNLPVSNVNPFTCETLCHAYDFSSFTIVDVTESGKKMNPSEWEDKTQFVDKEVYAYTVRDNIFDEKNWTKLDTSEAEK